ncbi:hypothetical protein OPT61_g8266 [Boeremia exigua]|uniref:Uncharacterized protein n=1 Tax=Boeremia exigua TaxID=749465 RepID=A0ACC2I0K1_9PLEO|nr:hypothetical protein OPT61_g8266 [Boeremia exigua]
MLRLSSRAAAGPQHLRYGQAGDNSRPLSQVAVAVGQAEGGAALLAAAARAGYSAILSVLTAVPQVSHCAGAWRQLQRLRVGGRAGPVGDRSTDAGAEARDWQEA